MKAYNEQIAKELIELMRVRHSVRKYQDKPIEQESAKLVGTAFCDDFEMIDLTNEYQQFMSALTLGKNLDEIDVNSHDFKIRGGNIKARMRMMFLRDVTQENHGLMVDNSNWTERMLGFFTVSDNGDISPMMCLTKTEVYEVALTLSKNYADIDKRQSQAIDFSISLTPTDGLGISNSDLEQIGAESYEQVDKILIGLKLEDEGTSYWEDEYEKLCEQFTKKVVDNVWNRHKRSQYKRNNLPIRMC